MKKIYILKDPRDNSIKYVGQTKCNLKGRLSSHIQDALNMRYNLPKCEWIIELYNLELTPLIEEIELVTNKKANEREQYWIDHYSNLGINLLNKFKITEKICKFRDIWIINKYSKNIFHFETTREVAKFLNTSIDNINKAIHSKMECKEYYIYLKNPGKDWQPPLPKNKVQVCLYNDKEKHLFFSIADAIKFTNGNYSSNKNGAYYALSHKDKIYRGWKWCILKEAHLKSSELLEKPEEVNQQPSTN